MRKHKLLILSVMLFCTIFFPSAAFADNLPDVVVSLKIDNPIMAVNGVDFEIDSGRGTAPKVINGRTLVPIRAIIEAFGGDVVWDEGSKAVLLTMEEDTIKLVIGSNIAYLNNDEEALDTAPAVINGRTMLPIRFIAEGFNLGVAWDSDTKTVSIIRDSLTDDEYSFLTGILPDYSGRPYAEVNGNKPFFKDYEIITGSFEYYSKLDFLGRCDVCFASIAEDIMPEEKRESISSVTPTGWLNASYDNIDGGYLYNRCHLIGFQLTGENANEKNLITGTRYLNVSGMLPFENMVADYIEETKNRVIYRSTPVFKENNLVADGVLLEAYSVPDKGQGISFCVYCYNVQPNIKIDYKTGASSFVGEHTTQDAPPEASRDEILKIPAAVYRTPTGKKYHLDPQCGGKNSFEITLDEAKKAGLTPCSKCAA